MKSLLLESSNTEVITYWGLRWQTAGYWKYIMAQIWLKNGSLVYRIYMTLISSVFIVNSQLNQWSDGLWTGWLGCDYWTMHMVFLFTTIFNMAINLVQSHSTVFGPVYPLKKEHSGDQSPPPSINIQYIHQSQLFVFQYSKNQKLWLTDIVYISNTYNRMPNSWIKKKLHLG
jgi:hypothetical protein